VFSCTDFLRACDARIGLLDLFNCVGSQKVCSPM
jgi:hypothetical protein